MKFTHYTMSLKVHDSDITGEFIRYADWEFSASGGMHNGPNSHMVVRNSGSDAFVCVVAPVEMGEEESRPVEVNEQ
jgi:hypothetical protein